MNVKIKKIFLSLIGLIIFIGLASLIFVIFRYLISIFVSLDNQVLAGIIAASTTVIISVFTVVVGKHLEKKKEIDHQLRIQKTKVYEKYMKEMFRVLVAKGNYSEKEMIKFLEEFSRELILWGGPKVIKNYCEFKNFGNQKTNTNDQRIMLYFEKVLFRIRRDLGHSNRGLNPGDLLTLFIKDISNVKELVSKYPTI